MATQEKVMLPLADRRGPLYSETKASTWTEGSRCEGELMTSLGNKLGLVALVLVIGFGTRTEARGPEDSELAKQVKELKDEVETLRKSLLLDNRLTRVELKTLAERLDRLEQAVGRLDSSSTRGAMSISPERLGTGTIRLDNRLGVRATVTIEGVQYSVPPLSVMTLRDQPAGSFTYRVTAEGFSWTPPRRTTLASRETWTLTID